MQVVTMIALVLTAQLSAGVKLLAQQSKDRPVSKVVNMLKSMQETLETEKAADEDMYEDLSCWCKENKQGKATEVKDAETAIGRMASEVEELKASTESLATEMETLAVEVKKATATLDQARIIHGNKMDELNAQESELNAEITAVSSAATAVSGSGTSLAQMPEGHWQKIAATIQAAVEKRGSLLDSTLSFRDREKLDTFFKDPVKVLKEASLLQTKGDTDGELVGMFNAMKEDFEGDLSAVTKQLAREKGSYEELMKSKKEEIEAGENSIESKRMQRVEKREDMIEKKHAMEEKQKSIASAQEFLALVEEKCSISDTEWVERQKTRQAEIDSVSQAIEVLDGEDAHALFSKTYSFLQEDSMDQRLKKASSIVARVGKSHSDDRLVALVASAEIKGMEKVKAAIDEMREALKKEQQDEVAKKDFCVSGFNDIAAKKAGVESEKSGHSSQVDKLEIKLNDISSDASDTKGKVEAAQKDLKTETEDHKKELKDFAATLADQKASQVVLKKALAKLKEFYETKPAFIQGKATQTPEGVPAGFSDYKTSSNGLKVLQILQDVILETKAMEKETTRAKDVAIKDYSKLVAASEKDIGALEKELNNLAMVKAQTKSDLLATKKSLKGDEQDLVDIAAETADLHEDCDFLMKNFELRKSARTDELEGLAQAKAILSGSK
eukprot:TRINITY_DN1483_c0_g1_i4.p1 TRINITY_DN1483_c0_g1~~TRINITY_DN1483_c0_g1_i4.p1  ORF type:complete len:672 (+),score=247.50 TRINITY_DN1483_c0_g1_i4:86-2101(+)